MAFILPLRYRNYPFDNPQLVGHWLNRCTARFIDLSLRNDPESCTGPFDDWHISIRSVPFGSSSRNLLFFHRRFFRSVTYSPFLETHSEGPPMMGDYNTRPNQWLLFLILYTVIALRDRPKERTLPFRLFTNSSVLNLLFFRHIRYFDLKQPPFYIYLASIKANAQTDAVWAGSYRSLKRGPLLADISKYTLLPIIKREISPRQLASGPRGRVGHQRTPPRNYRSARTPLPPATNPGYRTHNQDPTALANDKGDKGSKQPATDPEHRAPKPLANPPGKGESELPGGGDSGPRPSWLADLDTDYIPPELPSHVDPQYMVLRKEENPWLPPPLTRHGSPDIPSLMFDPIVEPPTPELRFADPTLSLPADPGVPFHYSLDKEEVNEDEWEQIVNACGESD